MTFAQVQVGHRFRWFGMLCLKVDARKAIAFMPNNHGVPSRRENVAFTGNEFVTFA